MGLYNHIFGQKKGYGKLLLKTSSTDANYTFRRVFVTEPTQFTYIDDNTGNVLHQGIFSIAGSSLTADLSLSSGSASLYIDVDDTGNGCYQFWHWRNGGKITELYMDTIPLVQSLWLSHSQNIKVFGKMLELTYFRTYVVTYDLIDFSFTTKLTSFYIQYITSASLVQTFDIRNNPNLTYLEASQLNYDYFYFNVSNHRLLQTLIIKDDNTTIDPNINSNYLPNLRQLKMYGTTKDYDFSNIDLSLITTLQIYAKNLSNLNQLLNLTYLIIYYDTSQTTSGNLGDIPNLETLNIADNAGVTSLDLDNSPLKTLIINNSNNLTILDLTTLINLTSFELQRNSALTLIEIDNGLNSQITKFKRSWGLNTIDVKVDNPTDANNEVSPYLPTVWIDYLTYNSWNFI